MSAGPENSIPQRRPILSGWSRTWIVIGGLVVLRVVWAAHSEYFDNVAALDASGQDRAPLHGYWEQMGVYVGFGVVVGACLLGAAFAAKEIALWIWRGFAKK